MTASPAADMLAQMRELLERMPARLPTTVRVGAGVTEALNGGTPVTRPLIEPPLPMGMDIIRDDKYPPGQWRIFDQWDEEISAGVLPVVGATVRIDLDGGTSKTMQMLTVSRDEDGQITKYTACDPAMLDPTSIGTDWFFNRRPNFRL